MDIRMCFIRWVCRVIKLPEGHIIPRWLLFIAYLLHPSRAIMNFNPWFKVDVANDSFTYNGVEISFQLLDVLTRTTAPGYAYIIERKDNKVEVTKIFIS